MIIKPMLAQSAGKPFNRKGYIYEPKLDGVRCIAFLDPTGTKLQARSGKDITFKFPELAELHKQVKAYCVLDGEIIGDSFNAVQHRIHQDKSFSIKMVRQIYPVTFHAFDLIFLDVASTENLQLVDRKDLLTANFEPSDVGKIVPWYETYSIAENLYKDTEGIMAKYMYSPYFQGDRSASWLKIKNFVEGTFYICGLTEGENARGGTFGSLILGEWVASARSPSGDKLKYVGNVGTGFTESQLSSMLSLAKQYRGECPFERIPDTDRGVLFWCRPELLCEVRYLQKTDDGKLRFPSFRKVERKNG